jgi:predicted permease
MFSVWQDVRFALRQLRKSMGFTVMTTLTLALGIGSATAVFSLVDAVLLKPLPFPHPERIMALDTLSPPRGGGGPATVPNETSFPNFADWRARARSFESMASWQGNSFTLTLDNSPAKRIDGMTVSPDFFHVLQVGPALGRTFTRSEEEAGNRSVIISHGLWQSAFGANAAAIGQTLHLSYQSYTIIGVLPASFQFPNAPDAQVWTTPAIEHEGRNPSAKQRGWNQLQVIGRLAPGVSRAQAKAEMDTIQGSLAAQYLDDKIETAVSVTPALDDLVGTVRRPLNILFACVCFLLLIACANVAGLLLTRTAARRSELALRSALGATRPQIVRQLLIESLTISFIGGAGGFSLVAFILHLAPSVLPADLPRLQELSLDSHVFLFSLAASLATGLLFGVLPAWRSSRLDPALALNDTTRSSTASRGQNRLHSALVIAETALGLVLLIGAGLLIRSFDKLLNVNPGFNHTHLITFRVGMSPKLFEDESALRLIQQLQSRLAAMPGVQQATYAFPVPLTSGDMKISFTIAGRPNPPGEDPDARASVVASNFFTSLQMPLRRGRLFTAAEDRPGSPPVVIVNQAFADRFFPGEDAVGKRITSGLAPAVPGDPDGPGQPQEIVGVVGNVVRASLDEPPTPEYFVPFAQASIGQPNFALRVAGDPASYIDTVRSQVAQMDPTLPVYAVRTNLLARSTAQQRFQTILVSAFAIIALVLSAIGLYAVLSYMVSQRTMELGLRIALGAQRGNILELILRRGLMLSLAGLALGLCASALLTRFLTALLFATKALDVATFVGMALVLFAISAVSSLVPAYRASRLDPNETLRQQ